MSVEKLIVDHMETWTSALQTRSTAGRGSSGKIDLYGIKKLRELILELAVRGKLVPQDPNDEPASELLKRIAAEKAELVKQGKIKKQKPLPEISEEEKPFELPVGWEWVRLGDFTNIIRGITFPGNEKSQFQAPGKIACLRTANVQEKIDWDDLIYISDSFVKRDDQYLQEHDIVMSMANSRELVGKVALASLPDNSKFTFGGFLSVLRPLVVNEIYLMALLRCETYKSQLIESASQTTNIANISLAKLNPLPVCIPPAKEQIHIVKKMNELMSLCDQLEQQSLTSLDAHQQLVETLLGTLTDSQNAEELAENWARINEHFDTLFTTEASVDALKQTILQLAVMGKLVPQDPNDEPASELLKRIAQEKAQLVKEGKIKKQKPLPPISDEEKPFELPEGWEWCLFEDIIDIQSGITKGRNLSNRTLVKVPYLRVANVQRGYLDLTEIKQIEIPIEEKEKYQVVKGDLLITEGGDWDTVGRTTVWCHDWYIANQNHVFKGRNIWQDVDPYWLETYMNSPFSRQYFANASKQTTNLASINKTQLRGCPVAIPPSSEAKKIMSKLHIFYKLCEELKNHIQSAQQTQLHLADALTDAAIN
ncbi:restriction endonuclease subunit S [Escherichia fergusonii]|uniref:restriction endonuclease subunit S n=1 Tax=Escherichia fergusonii TaxID=564 RepID=UPI000CF604D3|nr:restriction endonuclease subunit S [Escherichia fergusonii]MBY7196253.1 restriction endonuclease subunit S [Escherichia fergusonii]MBY7231942.1 restriction endonuclease subunit S [Escherichia fergusonii]MBY7290429.1 restriction endonuclease subunit S [Escherichia fergusonii]MBY7469745.1 restriction endonuclease subunit S [Escherichia fergusonii]MDE9743664.1 restriction endonuclease subunit S [Escherichia fergusonii]